MVAVLAGGAGVASACADRSTTEADAAVVTAVTPAGGAVNVDPEAAIRIEFSRAMMSGMEGYAALHRGTVGGPPVSGTWTWTDARRRLEFTPDAPLEPAARYTIHLGGGMMDADGHPMSYDSCLDSHGGEWVTGGMMSGDMMADGDMMGTGWRHANGSYGVMFEFRTR